MNNIKVSIIIPVYNCEKYISRCIDSILNQTYKNIEIIAINDGSKDNTKEILNNYAKKYPNIIKHIEQENKGIAKTRNYGIKIATGDYIAFIDNDDYLDKDYIEKYVNATENSKFDVVIGGYRRPDENGKIVQIMELKDCEEWTKMRILTPWAKIFKREYILKNDIEFLDTNIGEDLYFNIQAILITDNVKVLDYVGYNWFYNTESVSSTVHKDIRKLSIYKLLDESYRVVKEKNILNKHYDIIEMHFIRTIMLILSYSTKKIPYKIISEEYDKIFNWLSEHFPNYKKTKLVGSGKPKGEIASIQLKDLIFMQAHKLHLGKIMVYLYSKI